MKRYDSPCGWGRKCTDAEIDLDISRMSAEIQAVYSDKNIVHYEAPDVEEMKKIIETAKSYTGEWYHSEVVLKLDDFISEENHSLQEEIIGLGASHGIFLAYRRDESEEDKELIKKLFEAKDN